MPHSLKHGKMYRDLGQLIRPHRIPLPPGVSSQVMYLAPARRPLLYAYRKGSPSGLKLTTRWWAFLFIELLR
jgi:hypothetical protein